MWAQIQGWDVDWLVEVEAACRGSEADMALLHSHNVQVHEVAVHLPVSRWRVPAAHGQDLQALHGLLWGMTMLNNWSLIWFCIHFPKAIAASHLPVLILWLEGHQGALFAAGQDMLWGGAVDLLQLVALFLPLATICSHIKTSKVNSLWPTCMSQHSRIKHFTLKFMLQMVEHGCTWRPYLRGLRQWRCWGRRGSCSPLRCRHLMGPDFSAGLWCDAHGCGPHALCRVLEERETKEIKYLAGSERFER